MAELTSRERVLTALHHSVPDCVPYMELFVDEAFGLRLLNRPPAKKPAPISGALPVTCAFFGGHAYNPIELARALDLDGFCMSIQPRIYFVTQESEGQTYFVGGLIKTRDDLRLIDLPNPDDENIYAPAREFLQKYRSSNYAIGCFINLGSDAVLLSMGWENFAYAIHDDRKMLEEMFDIYTDWYARAVKHICKLGFDFIWAGDDIAFKDRLLVAPQIFRELFMPYWRRVAGAITLPWIFHSDGNFLEVLDDLLSLGMHALHPIEPDAIDIVALRRQLGTRVTLVGNIDISKLTLGTPEEVEQLTRDTIRQVAPGGSYILSSSNSLPRYCRVENVLAMVRACRTYGRYPIEGT
jgi:uroporphyrinogen decarboxylase